MKIRDLIEYGCDEAGCPELANNIRFEWNARFTRRLGDAKYSKMCGKGCIRLSSKLWPTMSEDEQHDTILHEVAHVIDGYYNDINRENGGHGHTWRKIAAQIGAKPKRYADADTANFAKFRRRVARYRLQCGCPDGHIVTKTMLTKMRRSYRRYSCTKCNTLVDLSNPVLI